jgi:hypothetical protein
VARFARGSYRRLDFSPDTRIRSKNWIAPRTEVALDRFTGRPTGAQRPRTRTPTEELVACGVRVDAVEPGRNMIEFARRRLKASELVRFLSPGSKRCRFPRSGSMQSFRVGVPLGRPKTSAGRKLPRCCVRAGPVDARMPEDAAPARLEHRFLADPWREISLLEPRQRNSEEPGRAEPGNNTLACASVRQSPLSWNGHHPCPADRGRMREHQS